MKIPKILALLAIAAMPVLAAPPVPEIDPALGVNSIALLAGAVLILKTRSK